ncbi:hypothetical protein [Clostridium perfringens]|uniref:Uncharacterized protein n=2 Tax=Clostridium perfringens TaxID=1502 RepID=A0AAP6WMQ7_CLOPF|nr:hypothetical protein [Clostridium perfringens]NP_612859.1 Gp30 protein [Clostridium phage phi3626]AAL96800.1 Gp30 protein [Clostridium phage phi3626]EDT22891.1 conserved domain protein [Clostridium perfringens B str. ATCC 3626]NGU30633.1 hypothetical protein [Clostridium perfringens]WEV05046.1 hypothetical protein PL322_13845 [Clostridium perfringens B]
MLKVAVVGFEDSRKTFLYKTKFLDLKPGDYVWVKDSKNGFKRGIFQNYTNAISRIRQAENWIIDRKDIKNGY